jgi:hypothetical protein
MRARFSHEVLSFIYISTSFVFSYYSYLSFLGLLFGRLVELIDLINILKEIRTNINLQHSCIFHYSLHSHGTLLTPGLDNTRLFISITAGAGTKIPESLFISKPNTKEIYESNNRRPIREKYSIIHYLSCYFQSFYLLESGVS